MSTIIGGRRCELFSAGKNGPAFLLAVGSEKENYTGEIFERVRDGTDRPFTLISFESADWDGDYSPWPVNTGDAAFSGGADKTLEWLKSELMPFAEDFSASALYCAGYSLAGLFAFYAFSRLEQLSGAVCCSASFWFPGFAEYSKTLCLPEGSSIYLSLGGKEERTSHPLMREVGNATRELFSLLRRSPEVASVTLEMNKGGHFSPSEPRLAKGITWMLSERH
ncbi:MAG: hypothetical protein II920_06245 [Clostridia bacterium]|nr:hypothetical protein [Clostridia bacterium]